MLIIELMCVFIKIFFHQKNKTNKTDPNMEHFGNVFRPVEFMFLHNYVKCLC